MNTTTMTRMQQQEQEHFTPATREAIHKAQYEAVRMNVEEVTPEHLFLGILAQDGDGVVETFNMLRLDQEVLRKQATTIFPSPVIPEKETRRAYRCLKKRKPASSGPSLLQRTCTFQTSS